MQRKIKQIDGVKFSPAASIQRLQNTRTMVKQFNQTRKKIILPPTVISTTVVPRTFGITIKKFLPGVKTVFSKPHLPVALSLAVLLLTFYSGMLTAWSTAQTQAEDAKPITDTLTPGGVVGSVAGATAQLPPKDSQVLFTTPIEYLKNYFEAVAEPEILAQRQQKIKQLLVDYDSPLVVASEAIANQSHWKLILAIAFAESTLGKNCVDNNCSNIGVKPGHPAWHRYSNYQGWVADFNRLLDKKYNDWTLQDMCGVYVQPCNKNWLLATRQILDDIQARGIE